MYICVILRADGKKGESGDDIYKCVVALESISKDVASCHFFRSLCPVLDENVASGRNTQVPHLVDCIL